MEFIERRPSSQQQLGQKKTIEVTQCKREEFDKFVKDKVDNNYLELLFYEEDGMVLAYYPEEYVLYFFTDGKSEPPPKEDPKEEDKEKDRSSPRASSLFSNGLLIFILLISSLFPTYTQGAGYFSGSIKEDPTNYSSLSQAKFNTPTGPVTIPAYLNVVQSKDYTDKAFSFLDPNRIKDQPTVTLGTLPNKANQDLLIALLSFRHKYTLDEIKSNTGIQVTQNQLEEATQLAIWGHASSVQLQYQIDVNSIKDASVRALATEITTWANQQVSSKGSNLSMGNFIFPMYEAELDATHAKTESTDAHNEYGPYTVQSQKDSRFASGVLGGILLDSSKKEIKAVSAGQTFYVRFPTSYTGDKVIRLVGYQNDMSLNFGVNRVWLDKQPKKHEIQFSVGKTVGNSGSIQVKAVDSFTGNPVSGVNVQVSTTSPIGAVKTDATGFAQYDAAVGNYKVSFSVPEGYLTPKDKEIRINFSGDTQTINLNLEWSQGIINFYSVDSQTLKPTGNSEAFIYDADGKAIKRIAFKDGRSSGITLPEGDFTLVQYKTDGNYAINTGTAFKSTPGLVTDVSVTQDPNAMPTTIKIDGASSSDSWVYTVSTGSKVLFKMNSSDKLILSLPVGSYSVMAVKSDGTAFTSPLNFTTVLNGATDVLLEREIGTETVSFTMVDTVKEEPIPNIVVGLFDEDHNLITYETASTKGKVTFSNVKKYSVYYVNIIAAPPGVSGYSADGNRFLGYTKDFKLRIYSEAEIKEVTEKDTLYRVPNVVYTGASYEYPK